MNSDCPVHGIYLLQHSPFANLCLCSGFEVSPLIVARPDTNEDPVFPQPQPRIPASSSPIQSPVTRPWQCALCSERFRRKQERNRHELAHLPFYIHCPAPNCLWRGNRDLEFRKHWEREDHHCYHEQFVALLCGTKLRPTTRRIS